MHAIYWPQGTGPTSKSGPPSLLAAVTSKNGVSQRHFAWCLNVPIAHWRQGVRSSSLLRPLLEESQLLFEQANDAESQQKAADLLRRIDQHTTSQ